MNLSLPGPIRRNVKGYTIVEALVAISILMMGVAAAAALSMTMVTQEDINARAARAVNWHENAVRLYHLGVGTSSDVSEIMSTMPGLAGLGASGLSISTASADVDSSAGGSFSVDVSDLTLTYNSVDDSSQNRTSVMKAVRYE